MKYVCQSPKGPGVGNAPNSHGLGILTWKRGDVGLFGEVISECGYLLHFQPQVQSHAISSHIAACYRRIEWLVVPILLPDGAHMRGKSLHSGDGLVFAGSAYLCSSSWRARLTERYGC